MDVWLEVRCCCEPRKMYGWLPVRRELADVGNRVRFTARRVERFGPEFFVDGRTEAALVIPTEIDLEVREFQDLDEWPAGERVHERAYRRRPALSSEDTPLGVIRRIHGFVEAPR